MKYVVVQRTGFVPYFLATPWSDGTERWDCHLDQARTFDGPTARRVRDQLNAKHPAAVIPVAVETLR
jgi:hypothetical protein